MEITFSANNRQEVVVLPWAPPELMVSYTQDNTVYDGLSFPLNLIGNVQLREFSLEGIFPNRRYAWTNPNSVARAQVYIDFFVKWQAEQVPIRVVITYGDGREFLNMPCTIDQFEYGVDKAGDVKYSLSVTEYRFVEV